jgi:hypothetical protein
MLIVQRLPGVVSAEKTKRIDKACLPRRTDAREVRLHVESIRVSWCVQKNAAEDHNDIERLKSLKPLLLGPFPSCGVRQVQVYSFAASAGPRVKCTIDRHVSSAFSGKASMLRSPPWIVPNTVRALQSTPALTHSR